MANKKQSEGDTIAQEFFKNKEADEQRIKERKQVKRIRLIMELVYLTRSIESIDDTDLRDKLKDGLLNVINELNFTDKERTIFDYECNSIGV
jgi:hypothetical protein